VIETFDLREAAVALLNREALLLDERRWDEWLALYDEDAVFWVPAWKGDHELTDDPDAEISLIYHTSRTELRDRVLRLQTGKSVTAMPQRRTVHAVGNVAVQSSGGDRCEISSVFQTYSYDPRTRRDSVAYGRYHHTLRCGADRLTIARKRIVLVNDRIPTLLDFYSI
jgi:benzoate/toluate 1,2-dioxygenase beta subunit/2,4,5-trichlorophenoxyacetic acid oxygenase 2